MRVGLTACDQATVLRCFSASTLDGQIFPAGGPRISNLRHMWCNASSWRVSAVEMLHGRHGPGRLALPAGILSTETYRLLHLS